MRQQTISLWRTFLWKSCHLRKEHLFLSFVEFVLPIAAIGLILIAKMPHGASNEVFREYNVTIFRKVSGSEIIADSFHTNHLIILYSPETNFTDGIMEKVKRRLESILPSTDISIHAANSEKEMEVQFRHLYQNVSDAYMVYGAGIVFEQVGSTVPTNLVYKIRVVGDFECNTDHIFPPPTPGPIEAGAFYLTNGFLALQLSVDDAYISFDTDKTNERHLQAFPHPPYEDFKFEKLLINAIPQLTCFGFIFTITSLIKSYINEKNTGSMEFMKLVGAPDWMVHCASWLLFTLLIHFWSVLILTILLKYPFGGSALLEYSNGFVIWMFYILFIIHSCVFTLAISALFNNALVGETIGSLIWIFSCIAIDVLLQYRLPSVFKFIIAMVPTGYIILGFKFIGNYEAVRVGVGFNNLFYSASGFDNMMTLGEAFIAMIVGTVVFLIALNYIIAIRPGKYGTAKPWFFFIMHLYTMLHKKSKKKVNIPLLAVERGILEEVPSGRTVGLCIRNLHKKFGNVTAVKKLSLDIYEGEITALLGHNGAGKTTLMSIITGLLSPDDGEIFIDGQNIFHNLHKVRQNWGLCTQHNLLFPYFTTSEHIIFYAMLKGLSRKKAIEESKRLLRIFCMEDKEKVIPNKLSGGMKRKLSMAIALIDDPKLLILDEPTSGMDPQSRRELWDVLLAMRGRRTVIITTHFMEEADVLGDRIAIMDHGVLKCYGSSLFLKKHYGTGYILTLILSEKEKMDHVSTLITSIIPEAVIKDIRDTEVSFGLPTSKCSSFSELFSMLESSPNLGIKSFGLSCTTMEDVFLRVSDEAHNDRETVEGQETVPVEKFAEKVRGFNSSNEALVPMKAVGAHLVFQSIKVLMMKKIIWSIRNWFSTLFFVIICPAVITIMAARTVSGRAQTTSCPDLIMDLNMYGQTTVLMSRNNNPTTQSFKSIINSQQGVIKEVSPNETIIQGLLAAFKDKYRNDMIVAADFTNGSNLLYSTIGIHAPSIAVNLFSNTLLKLANSTQRNSITTYNHPLLINMEICQLPGQTAAIISTSFGMCLLIGLIYCFGNVLSFAVSERISMFKHLQLMCGLSPVIYWAIVFTWDFFLYGIITMLVVNIIICVIDPIHLTSSEVIGPFLLVLFLGLMSTLWMAYFISLFLKSYASSYSFYTTINILGLIVNLMLHGFSYAINKEIFYFINIVLMFIPYYALSSCLIKVVMFAFMNFQCKSCNDSRQVQLFCEVNQVKNKSCFSWENYDRNDETYETGIYMEIMFLVIDSIIYGTLTMLYEHHVFHIIWNYLIKFYHGNVEYNHNLDDSDVINERHTIKSLNKEISGPVLVVDGLAKKFSKPFTAVHGVSFAVNQGECLGLLGVNGAGKTTTFRMLTGDLLPSDGNAFTLGYSLRKQRDRYLSCVGYCPQGDGLNESLTGYETLTLFACLRGVQPSEIKTTVKNWIYFLGLQEYAHKPCGIYSGGNKRKLSTGISLIGLPLLVCLDEPTSGVDPVSRRKLWNVLEQSRKNGQTFVICSHSMDECEAVCTRITIMACGQMRCIGSVQYLKHKYCQGFIIYIKIKPHEESELEEVKEQVKGYISTSCFLKDEHFGLLHYHLTDPNYKLSTLFERMEDLKERCHIIDDYIITQSTMEQVFLSFAEKV